MTSRSRLLWGAVTVAVLAGAGGLYWFQPWRLFTNSTVNEPLPSAEASRTALDSESATQAPSEPQNVLLASGMIISHEHESSGTVRLIRLADGQVQVTVENLATSDGPRPSRMAHRPAVIDGRDGWFVFDDGRYVELGPLKANNGNHVYDVPAGTNLDGLSSFTIWCKRFSVSFGAARLDPQ